MAIEQIKETDTLNQGRIKINAILDQSNASSEKVDAYQEELKNGVDDAKKIADTAGKEAIKVAEEAGAQANATANKAMDNANTAITIAGNAVSTANNNKQEFDALRNDFDKLVGEAGDSNPEIVQARTDTQGVTQPTLATRLLVDFNDRMTKSEGVSLLSGTTNVKIPMDFSGKTAGNTATNAHQYFTDVTAKSLKKPKDIWNEVSQAEYNKLVSRDDSGVSSGSTQTGVIPQQLGSFNALEAAKKLIPQIFEGLNQEEAVSLLKNSFVAFTISERAKATSPNNKTIKVSTYIESTDSWATQIQESAGEYKDISAQITDKNFITSEGVIYLINYTDPSNGVTTANLDIDYSAIQLEISVNVQDVLEKSGFVKSKQLNDHVDDKENPHQVTAEQVGAYSKTDSTDLFINKTEAENGLFVAKKTVVNSQDWDKILDAGIYTVFGASGANRPYSGAAYGALVVYADNTFVSQTYMYKGETYTRSRQGSPATWTSWNKMLVEKEQPFEAWYSPGTNHVGFKNKARYNLGPEFSNVGQRLGLPMKSNPLEWNSGRWQAKVLRDCKLNVSGTVKYQVGGSRGVLYAYTHIDKGLDEGVGDLGIGSAVGAVGGLNYQNVAAFDLNVTLKKGEYFAFRLELAADKQLDNTQLSSMHITELV
ncbi:pyocin knob domain-containing protein [Enterococcus faecalis]|uniref:pyocin knob domain-containing protein n=1 Tax=Enterococcus faecalis TaxID=1351 RepID=UPI0019E5BEC1|nr:hypothetical protein [Enterococcus faecalis]EIB6797005.1 hypothetical protein [Enterococcus faecalis]MCV6008367.1 hypothetical protein [Enterococcus faecalis]WOA34591.1 hypothetical protein RX144_12195 [Enterococcus faecalis]HAP5951437.1 hypothetical protein [Enterococcus faecalis]HBC4196667.1 hypothetical protein [Enterococcus faecalis]